MSENNKQQERGTVGRTTRRAVLKAAGALGVASTLPMGAQRVAAASSPSLEKYVDSLPIPAVREPDGTIDGSDYYEIPLEQFSQKLHRDLPETTLWGYDGLFPGKTIEAQRNEPIKVRFDNSPLATVDGHLLGVDGRVHGTTADDYDWPPGEEPAQFPEIRTVTHAHGLHVEAASDGYPEAWESPGGEVKGPFWEKAVYDYTNRQPAATLWYHDHALGITRLNVYAGLAGFYLIRDAREERLNLPSGDYEVPILVQDRTFKDDGSGDLYYPETFAPEFAGDTSVVNGKVWPHLEVEPRTYRFRFLNGSNGRTFSLRLERNTDSEALPVHQIGVDLGFLPNTVTIPNDSLEYLVLAPAERGDVVVDFSGHEGETFTLKNYAEMPYAGEDSGSVDTEDFPGLPEIMQFRVTKSLAEPDTSANPTALRLPSGPEFRAQNVRETRYHTLDTGEHDGIDTHFLNDSLWDDESAVVKPQLGTTEVWWLANTTGDTHPIHLHLVEFQVHEIRQFNSGADYEEDDPDHDGFIQARYRDDDPSVTEYLGDKKPIPENYAGDKDTVRVDPHEAVAIITQFGNFTGRYVWHCHILEHEDQEMMLPYEVVTGRKTPNQS
ncbi:multicopper oxidase family protein [Salinigranum sp.]|uniref:multicopper oxidase family protein n=1 Tax=Salinigranum sp. TaxID=1966351 RepID=UPI003567FF56